MLLLEKHITRAGEKLGVTQSAMSLSLRQLRQLFHDDLLVRGQHGKMTLTPLAKYLLPYVREAIDATKKAFTAHIPFDSATSNRKYRIGVSSYIALVLLPRLIQILIKEAPQIKIVHHLVLEKEDLDVFEDQGVDIIIGNFPNAPVALKFSSLFSDRGVLVADKHHPFMKKKSITLKDFLKYPQIFTLFENETENKSILAKLEKQSIKLLPRLITHDPLLALQVLPGTMLITNTAVKLAKSFLQPLGLAMKEAPYSAPSYHANMYWHPTKHNDPSHSWLRKLIKEHCATE